MSSLIIFIAFAASGLLIVGLGIPLARRSVRPNHFYGLRIPATLNNETVWYEANAGAGRDMIVAGLAIVVVAMLVFLAGVPDRVAVFVNIGFVLLATVVDCVRSARKAKDLARRVDAAGERTNP